jgi:hypothetical protein
VQKDTVEYGFIDFFWVNYQDVDRTAMTTRQKLRDVRFDVLRTFDIPQQL